jgi:hypothetical protein
MVVRGSQQPGSGTPDAGGPGGGHRGVQAWRPRYVSPFRLLLGITLDQRDFHMRLYGLKMASLDRA